MVAESAAPFLNVEGLTIRFGGLTAVGGLDMAVAKGSIHALIGPNGAGKSTTFNCISRFYTPSAGRITYDGRDITRMPAREMAGLGIARSFQNLELFGELTVFENVLIGAHVHAGRSWRDAISARPRGIVEHVEQLLERTGLTSSKSTAFPPPMAASRRCPRSRSRCRRARSSPCSARTAPARARR